MSAYSVFLPAYSIGTEVYGQAVDICAPYGKRAVVIGGFRAMESAGERLHTALKGSDIELMAFVYFGGDATLANIQQLEAHPAVQAADMIFAMGGGRVCDTCKVLGDRLAKPVFSFPTVATNCAPCTRASVLYGEDGAFQELFVCVKPPAHTFIDTQIIANAPHALLRRGIGDAVSKEYESTAQPTHLLGFQMVRTQIRPLLEYGAQALCDCGKGHASDALAQVALDIIIRMGLVAVFEGGTSAQHNGPDGATAHRMALRHLPGELVAYGVLVLLTHDRQYEERYRIFSFCRSVGLPTCVAETELAEEHLHALLEATEHTPPLAHEALHHAMLDLEAFHAMHHSHAV